MAFYFVFVSVIGENMFLETSVKATCLLKFQLIEKTRQGECILFEEAK